MSERLRWKEERLNDSHLVYPSLELQVEIVHVVSYGHMGSSLKWY